MTHSYKAEALVYQKAPLLVLPHALTYRNVSYGRWNIDHTPLAEQSTICILQGIFEKTPPITPRDLGDIVKANISGVAAATKNSKRTAKKALRLMAAQIVKQLKEPVTLEIEGCTYDLNARDGTIHVLANPPRQYL